MITVDESIGVKKSHAEQMDSRNFTHSDSKSDLNAFSKDANRGHQISCAQTDQMEHNTTAISKSFEDAILDLETFRGIDIPERKAFLSPWLKENSISMIYGWRGCGKTFFVLGILYHIIRGLPFGPWNCELSGSCLFLDGEMTISDDKERLESMGFYDSEMKNEFLIYSDHYASRLGLPRANLVDENWRTLFKKYLIDNKVKLLVLDNIASLSPGLDENAKKDWDPINTWLLDLRFNEISTIILHHESKDGKQRGTAAREDNLDVSIQLKRPRNYTPENGCHFIVHFAKARVSTKYLPLISDIEFRLIEDQGRLKWNYTNPESETKREVLRMLDEGSNQKKIADTLSKSKGYISKIRKILITDGYLTEGNKLIGKGHDYVKK